MIVLPHMAFRLFRTCTRIEWVVLAVIIWSAMGGQTQGAENIPAAYTTKPDFRALAMAGEKGQPFTVAGEPVVAYVWYYDTAEEAVRAAEAACRQQLPVGPTAVVCRVVRLGDIPVPASGDLPRLQADYERQVLARLEDELARTGRRETITRLSTVYQKIGQYDASEALLIDLAMGGEHLAQNALAYHWAELRKRLPEALALVDAAISQDPDFFSYHDTRGLVLARLGRLAEAETALQHAVSLEAHPIALDHYGDILWLRQQPEKAGEQWRRAMAASRNILFVQRLKGKLARGMTGDIVFE